MGETPSKHPNNNTHKDQENPLKQNENFDVDEVTDPNTIYEEEKVTTKTPSSKTGILVMLNEKKQNL